MVSCDGYKRVIDGDSICEIQRGERFKLIMIRRKSLGAGEEVCEGGGKHV